MQRTATRSDCSVLGGRGAKRPQYRGYIYSGILHIWADTQQLLVIAAHLKYKWLEGYKEILNFVSYQGIRIESGISMVVICCEIIYGGRGRIICPPYNTMWPYSMVLEN